MDAKRKRDEKNKNKGNASKRNGSDKNLKNDASSSSSFSSSSSRSSSRSSSLEFAMDDQGDDLRQELGLVVEGKNIPNPWSSFSDAQFPDIVNSSLRNFSFDKPTPIQAQAWPLVLQGRDLVGLAETGSGKTLAFILPALVHIMNKKEEGDDHKEPYVLVLAPTRELAQQIAEVAEQACKGTRVRSVCVFGGMPKDTQAKALRSGVEIVIATPGRLLDHIQEGTTDMARVSYLVLDEADRMLDMGFEVQIKQIIEHVPAERQTLMFSATWPHDVQRIASKFFVDPAKIIVGRAAGLSGGTRITQIVELMDEASRGRRLRALLKELYDEDEKTRILVFMLYKKSCKRIAEELQRERWPCDAIHGDNSQVSRNNALAAFKSGKAPILVATDVAARGLDIKNVKYVINVEFPLKCEDYIHRIGRTGRAGESGTAYTFLTPDNKEHARELVSILEKGGQKISSELADFAGSAPGIKPKKTALTELYGDAAKGKGDLIGKKATRITFDD